MTFPFLVEAINLLNQLRYQNADIQRGPKNERVLGDGVRPSAEIFSKYHIDMKRIRV